MIREALEQAYVKAPGVWNPGGIIPNDPAIPLLLARAGMSIERIDALVVPSTWFENSPITIHESYLFKTPILTSDIGGMAELFIARSASIGGVTRTAVTRLADAGIIVVGGLINGFPDDDVAALRRGILHLQKAFGRLYAKGDELLKRLGGTLNKTLKKKKMPKDTPYFHAQYRQEYPAAAANCAA